MFDKIKGRFEDYIVSKGIKKGVAAAVSGTIGLMGSAVFTAKVQPVLDQFGVKVDQAQVAQGLTVLFTGVAMAAWNFIKFHTMEKK